MLRQYHELKQQHPGTLLFFRLGDFYELFFDDAVIGSRELQITLTARNKERGEPVPMCGRADPRLDARSGGSHLHRTACSQRLSSGHLRTDRRSRQNEEACPTRSSSHCYARDSD